MTATIRKACGGTTPRPKTHQVATRYSAGEHALIEEAAAVVGQEFGTFVRTVAAKASQAVVAPATPQPSGESEES